MMWHKYAYDTDQFLNPQKTTYTSPSKQSGTKPNLVAKILATNFGVFFVI